MKRRVRALPPGYLVGTKGHSVLKKKTYLAAKRPSIDVEEVYIPKMPISRKIYYEYAYPQSVFHDASAYSNAVVDDSYEIQHQSRGRDHRLLSQMNDALHPDVYDPLTSSSPPSSRSSIPRNYPQLQHKSRKSTRFDTSSTESPHSSLEATSSALTPFLGSPTSTLLQPPPYYENSKLGIGNSSPQFTSSLRAEKPMDSAYGGSPLTAYIKGRFSDRTPTTVSLPSYSTTLPTFETEDIPSKRLNLYKNPYLDDLSSDDEYDYESKYVPHRPLLSNKNYKPGDYLKYLRRKRYDTDEGSGLEEDFEDSSKGAYAITYNDDDYTKGYSDDEEDYTPIKHRYLPRESSPDESDLPLTPYRSKLHKYHDQEEDLPLTPYRSKLHKYDDQEEDTGIGDLMALAISRARDTLRSLTGLDTKAGLLSIEGDIRPYGGELSTFKLQSPFQFQGPLMLSDKPSLSIGDEKFERYVQGMKAQREEERRRLDIGLSRGRRQLTSYNPQQYSLRPIGYITDKTYNSYEKSLLPSYTTFDRTIISPSSSRKSVHFEDDYEPRRLSYSSLSRELVPLSPSKWNSDNDLAIVPRRKRYPVYEYSEEIPLKLTVDLPRSDSDFTDDMSPGRLSVIERIRIKALLVGEDKLSDPDRRRKPRKRYYAGKPHRDLQENLSILGIPDTSYLKASKPFDPTPSYGWKAIRDVEGYTKPKNVMSWQYRLDSHLEPEDLTYKPATYGKMRDQVRDVQDKMDRHRQLLDRYADRATLDTGYGEEIAAAGRATEEVGSGEGINKVSPLRKKLRKVICKARHDPSYYDD